MKNLLKYLNDYKRECILGPLLKLLEALFELFVPLVVAAIIDNGISFGNKAYVLKMCSVLVLFGLLGLSFSVTAQYFAAKAAVGFASRVRSALFRTIQKLSYSELDEAGSSTLITRMTSDMNQLQNGVNMTLRLFLRSPFVVFGAMTAAFLIDFKSALIFVCTIPILSIIVFGIMLISIPLYDKVQKSLDRVTLKTKETLSGVRVIRAFCKEGSEVNEFENANRELNSLQRYAGKISALMNPLTYTVINIAIVILIYTGAVRVNAGIITQGTVVALYNYMSQILVELIKLANLIITLTRSVASGKRISEILTDKGKICSDTDKFDKAEADLHRYAGEYAVEFDNVYLRYKNAGDYALKAISFNIKRGETVGIIGGTGSGKTSLINMIPGFYKAEKGIVRVFGSDVNKFPADSLRSCIGIVPQKAVLFSGSLRENLKWGNENATDDELFNALKAAQAYDFVISKDGGLSYFAEQEGKNLSGGQRQRLTIARAIVKKPDILILDDSASALDFATDAALRKSIKALGKDMTVFIVSQRTSSIRHADKIIVLENGTVEAIGTHDELLKASPTYGEIYQSQFKEEDGI